jgi:hypothetical protein
MSEIESIINMRKAFIAAARADQYCRAFTLLLAHHECIHAGFVYTPDALIV